jgi:hypothetical protein
MPRAKSGPGRIGSRRTHRRLPHHAPSRTGDGARPSGRRSLHRRGCLRPADRAQQQQEWQEGGVLLAASHRLPLHSRYYSLVISARPRRITSSGLDGSLVSGSRRPLPDSREYHLRKLGGPADRWRHCPSPALDRAALETLPAIIRLRAQQRRAVPPPGTARSGPTPFCRE